jgi:hypothetical protein
MVGLPRQLAFSRLAGHEDTNDADRISVDSAMRRMLGGLAKAKRAASPARWPLRDRGADPAEVTVAG